MKTITKNWLNKRGACPEAVEWVLSQKDKSINNLFKLGLKEKRYNWLNWGICRLFNRKQRIQYAVYATKQVLDIYEKKYPNDDRPRKAIRAAEKCINNDTKKNRDAAYAAADAVDAAYAVDAAAYAAYAAAYAAYAAYAAVYAADAVDAAAYAAYAAYAAAYAAYVAVYAAYAADAAVYAVYAAYAAKEKLQIKILKYGMKLLKE